MTYILNRKKNCEIKFIYKHIIIFYKGNTIVYDNLVKRLLIILHVVLDI